MLRQRPACNVVLESAAFEQLHHDELLLVMLTDLVHRADVRKLCARNYDWLEPGVSCCWQTRCRHRFCPNRRASRPKASLRQIDVLRTWSVVRFASRVGLANACCLFFVGATFDLTALVNCAS